MSTECKFGHWVSEFDFEPDNWVGFIYCITNKINGRRYIGKKFFQSTLRKVIKGQKNRKRVTKDSNWRSYTGSSKWLNEDITLLGKENFEFCILSLHESRSSLAYREVELLVQYNVMRAKLDDGTKAFYNGLIPQIRYSVLDETENEKQFKTTII